MIFSFSSEISPNHGQFNRCDLLLAAIRVPNEIACFSFPLNINLIKKRIQLIQRILSTNKEPSYVSFSTIPAPLIVLGF